MKRGVNGFRPERLVQALDARRLSQVQLASLANVSAGSISKWRKGQQEPTNEALERIARALNLPLAWFLKQLPEFSGSAQLFRSNASALKSARDMMAARQDWSKELASELGKFVEYPDVNFPVRNYLDPKAISDEEIEQAAAECRQSWKLGLGPIADIVLAIENAGGIVVREETGIAKIEGLSSWCAINRRPFVYLNADKANGFRSRFDAAHELGHIILHKSVPLEVAKENHDEMERQAHLFAGAFLMPGESFANDVPVVPTIDQLLVLKLRWKASVGAMLMRLRALQLIDKQEETNLWKRKSARFGGKSERFDDEISPEEPRLLRRSIALIIEEKICSRENIPSLIGLSSIDVEKLASLPDGYFEATGTIAHLNAVRLRLVR